MSKDTFDVVTAIASRQPALNPARHHVSPALLEFRLQQVEKDRDELLIALREIYNHDADYIRINHLGPVNHNHCMAQAHALLARIKGE